ncbi:murein hydrolase activator EnvC family protein [Capnocytophaga canimorsus]|uniref:murein hydrolase activator EnvC family protein n=1 Tax=Capnocytophaga canimorsus TaxID=28188 RepID=UPI0037D247E6
MKKQHFIFLMMCFLCSFRVQGQTSEQKDLEERKKVLIEQIKQMALLRSEQTQQRKSVLTQMEETEQKIQARTKLIHITQQQSSLLTREINKNTKQIQTLENELKHQKQEYTKLIKQSYKNKSKQNRLMFLLASESFWQGYKRMLYIKQYTDYRKKQAEEIQQKTIQIQAINQQLTTQRQEKEATLSEIRREEQLLQQEKREQQLLAENIRKKESDYEQQIREKQRQADAIDREIQRLIRQSIAENNKAGKVGRIKDAEVVFTLTPESRKVAESFEASKGNLIWPVAKGYKSQGFGIYSDPIYPDVKHYNNGVTIVTETGADARAVFHGEVSVIQAIPGSNKAVHVRHGNYITIYYNLTQVYVKKGDKVKAKTPLGRIFTDADKKTEMKFFIYKNTSKLNPEYWIHKM